MNSELQAWINKAKQPGMKDAHIQEKLRAQGWSDSDVASTFQQTNVESGGTIEKRYIVYGIVGALLMLLPTIVLYLLAFSFDVSTDGMILNILVNFILPTIAVAGLILTLIISIYTIRKRQLIIGVSLVVAALALGFLCWYVMRSTASFL